MGPSKKKSDELEARMKRLKIKREDIVEKFIKASGRGGQKVNKTSSAVFLKHIPTQLSVKCGKARSQILNRFLAMRNLVDKIEEKLFGTQSKETQKIERIRKQKLKRKKRSKNQLPRRKLRGMDL